MGGQAVHAMQGQVFFKAGQAEETLERGSLHARGVGEAHVILDEGENLPRILVGESEAAENFGAHGDADLDVAVEANAVRGDAEGGWLADVVEQRAPGEGRGAAGL